MSDPDFLSRLQKLQSRFTWDLRPEDLQLEDLSVQLQHDIDLELGQPGTVAYACRFLAYVRYLQCQPAEALELLNQSETKTREVYDDERRFIVMYGDMAWLKYHTEDLEEAQRLCQRVEDILVRHPAAPDTLHPEVYGEKGWTLLKLSRSYYPEAKENFCKALEMQPDDCELNNGYAIVLYRMEEDDSGSSAEASPATRQLQRAVEINPRDGVLLSMLALKLMFNGNLEEVDKLVERALKVARNNTQVIRYLAKYLRKRNRLDEAIKLLQDVLKMNTTSTFIHHQLAQCYIDKKKLLKKTQPRRGDAIAPSWGLSDETAREIKRLRSLCIHHLEKTVQLKSGFKHAKAELALQYAEMSDKERAQQMFDEVLEGLEEEPWRIRYDIYRNYATFCQYHTDNIGLAFTYYKKGNEILTSASEKSYLLKRMKEMAKTRLDSNWRDATPYAILGYVAKEDGDWRAAEEYYEKALERDEDNTEYLSALCELRLKLQ
ncbi:interferon-induced protein with tetratricopeptide repeats 5 [Oryzias melastigma]|uniref:Interferon-induced protein with tetratricopeptide repeats 10 n=1 Tax=Oryzias melastigma TaxID=30732 RepID=A0A3B3C862_ORYME|nr:interferon-induced protein with tetratricopeptide repeats 5 [Oryzias melastigma]